MSDEQDYYKVLGVETDADVEEIRRAYRAKAMAFHPDRMFGAAEEEKRLAGEKLKLINLANQVLSDPATRRKYHKEWLTRNAPPRPVVDLPRLRFYDVAVGLPQSASFVVRNEGGPYSNIRISNPDSWVTIAGYKSLTEEDELPLRVNVEAQGDQWGKSYRDSITVSLDNSEIQVAVELSTRPAPYSRPSPQAGPARPRTPYGRPRAGRVRRTPRPDYASQQNALALSAINGATLGMKWVGVAGIAASAFIGVVIIMTSPFPLAASLFMAPLVGILFGIAGAVLGAIAGALGGAIVGLVYGAVTR